MSQRETLNNTSRHAETSRHTPATCPITARAYGKTKTRQRPQKSEVLLEVSHETLIGFVTYPDVDIVSSSFEWAYFSSVSKWSN